MELTLGFILLVSAVTQHAAAQTEIGGLSGSHTDIPRWCGKPYEAGSPNFNPGGQLYPPKPTPSPPLSVQIQPRYSIYDSSEQQGEFLVSATTSRHHGDSIPKGQGPGDHQAELEIVIHAKGVDLPLAHGHVVPGSKNQVIKFDLHNLKAQLSPHQIEVSAISKYAHGSYKTGTELYYLPAKNSGSTVKIDNLNGGMLVANNATKYKFESLLPFGFYTSCSGYLNNSLANITTYKDLGFNAINPVCAFPDGDMTFMLDALDGQDLWYQYDMRGSYLNLSSVAEQIPLVKDHSNLLSWYTADEPDGWQYALNSTKLAYDLLKREDPYHPTGLVLNCDNYYFEEYTSGTDYIMQDAYPVGIDPHFSRKFNTTCNATYGDCGCDNCVGSLLDVSDRLDTFTEYQEWLGQSEKPLWSVLQAFSGEQYWARDPTPDETYVMMILSFNHKAKAIMSWTFPTSKLLSQAHSSMAKVASSSPVSHFLLNGDPTPVKTPKQDNLDVAIWSYGTQKLVAIAHTADTNVSRSVTIDLPFSASKIALQPWGSSAWMLSNGHQLKVPELASLATSMLIFDTTIVNGDQQPVP